MDVKEYITSGILEAYVLGGLSDKERQEVECMSSIYEEIGEELAKLQSGFEAVAEANAIAPPTELKASIMDAIDTVPQDRVEEPIAQKQALIIPLKKKQSQPQIWRIAAILLVLVSAGFGYLYSTNSSKIDAQADQVATLDKDIASQKALLKIQLEKQQQLASLNAFISNKETQQVIMPGTEIEPNAATRVFYNPSENQIALQIDYLPEAPTNKQYQLWAIVDGQPTDMGVLESTEAENLLLVAYTSGTPDAFAITLEKSGGSAQPDLTNLYVIGNI
jgi:anti-sigma-K factor RskA